MEQDYLRLQLIDLAPECSAGATENWTSSAFSCFLILLEIDKRLGEWDRVLQSASPTSYGMDLPYVFGRHTTVLSPGEGLPWGRSSVREESALFTFPDLSAAFDTIDNGILLDHLCELETGASCFPCRRSQVQYQASPCRARKDIPSGTMESCFQTVWTIVS